MTRTAALALFVLAGALASAGGSTGCGRPNPKIVPLPDPEPVSDKEALQGVWKLTAADRGDGAKAPDAAQTAVLVFKSDRLTYHESRTATGNALAVVWDPAKTPKRLALQPLDGNGTPIEVPEEVWIYRLDGDVLEVAYSVPVGPPPAEFKARARTIQPPVSGVHVFRYARSKDPPP